MPGRARGDTDAAGGDAGISVGELAAGGRIVNQARKGMVYMATEDKAAHKVTEVKGKVKEEVGKVTGDEEMEAEGQADQVKGNLKQAGDKIKDAFTE